MIREKTKAEMELEALLRIVGELKFQVIKETDQGEAGHQLAPTLQTKFQQLTNKVMDVQTEVDKQMSADKEKYDAQIERLE